MTEKENSLISKLKLGSSNSETVVLNDGEEIRSRIIISINEAKFAIYLAVAFFTDRGIADALIKAHKRGVNVQVVISNAQMNSDIRSILANNNLVIYQVEDRLMHAKFMVIDDAKVINGSYNYTLRASRENKEVVNIAEGKEVGDYKSIFMSIIEGLTPVPPDEDGIANSANLDVDQSMFADRLEAVVFTTLDDHNKEETENLGHDEAKSSSANPEIFVSRINQYSQIYRDKLVRNDSIISLIKGKLNNLGSAEKQKLDTLYADWNEVEVENHKYETTKLDGIKSDVLTKSETLHNEQKELKTEIQRLELEKGQLSDEIDELAVESTVIRFWRVGTVIRIIGLVFICAILSMFFASTLYNLLSLEDIVQHYIEYGGDSMPKGFPIYLDIFDKLLATYGNAGYAALFLFLLPLFISNIGLVATKMNKYLASILSVLFGMIFIDVIVAIKISEILQNSFNMLYPSEAEVFTVWSALDDIFLVFIFGFFPLMVSHVLMASLNEAYINSNPELSDKENHKQKVLLKKKIWNLEAKLIPVNAELEVINGNIEGYRNDINSLIEQNHQMEEFFKRRKEEKKAELHKEQSKIDGLVGRYVAMIERGDQQILRKATESIATSYMHGFKSFITEHYSEKVSEEKIRLIQSKFTSWRSENFG